MNGKNEEWGKGCKEDPGEGPGPLSEPQGMPITIPPSLIKRPRPLAGIKQNKARRKPLVDPSRPAASARVRRHPAASGDVPSRRHPVASGHVRRHLAASGGVPSRPAADGRVWRRPFASGGVPSRPVASGGLPSCPLANSQHTPGENQSSSNNASVACRAAGCRVSLLELTV